MCVYVGIFFDIPAAGGVLCASLASLGVPCGRVQGGGAGRRPSAGGLQPAIESLILYETGEVVWFRRLLHDIGEHLPNPTPALEDSRSAIAWTHESASWSKTRHVDTAFHKIREWKEKGILRVEYCQTSAQLADQFTKSLPIETHRRLTQRILNSEPQRHGVFQHAAPAA